MKDISIIPGFSPVEEAKVCVKRNNTPRRILLVEDIVIIAKDEARTLKKHGYEVIIATSGEKAVEKVKADPAIDLVLMDIDLGRGIDGKEAAKKILTFRNIPVVFLTSHSEQDMVEKVRGITRYGYVLKNSGDFVLQSSIEMAFELFEAHETLKRKSEERYRALFETSRDAIFTIEPPSWKCTSANPVALEMFGAKSEKEMMRFEAWEISPEFQPDGCASIEKSREMIEKTMRVGSSSFEWVHRRMNGDEFFSDVLISRVDQGDSAYLQATVRDITEHKRREAKLTEELARNKKLLDILDMVPAYVFIKDNARRYLYANRMIQEMLGHSAEELYGNPFEKFLAPDSADLEKLKLIDTRILEYGEKTEEEMEHTPLRLGEKRIFWEVKRPIFDAEGKICGLCGVSTDITERKRMEHELNEHRRHLKELVERRTEEFNNSNALLQAEITERKRIEEMQKKYADEIHDLYNNAPCGYHSLDKDGLMIRINDTELSWLGYTREEIIGKKHFLDLICGEHHENFFKEFLEFKEKGWVNDLEIDMVCRDGRILPVLLSATAVVDSSGNYLMSRSTIYDITRRKQAETELKKYRDHLEELVQERTEELEKINRMLHLEVAGHMLAEQRINSLLDEKELLLKEVHHRIKNNMSTMTSLLFLQSKTLHDPPAVAALMDARSRLQSMEVLYNKLYCSECFLSISISAYLPPLLDEIARQFSNRDKVTIETDIIDCILNARVLSPLGIIMNELITNAMKYAFTGRDEGMIKVSASLQGTQMTVTFQDNGNGIPERIEINKSTGFGLQLVDLMTRQLKGNIRLERQTGSKFILEFTI